MPNQDALPEQLRPRAPKTPFPEVPSKVRYARGGRARRMYSPKQRRWTDRKEEKFLDALAASGNIKWSAAAVDVSDHTAFRQRRLRPDFAAKWAAALDQAYVALEFELVSAARASLADLEFDTEAHRVPKMSVADAIRVLSIYKASLTRGGRMAGPEAPLREMEDLRESIMKKVRAIRGGPKTA